MEKEQFIREALGLPISSIDYHVSTYLSTLLPERALLQDEESSFDIEEFAQDGHCHIAYKAIVYNQTMTSWQAPEIGANPWESPAMSMTSINLADQTEAEKLISESAKNVWLEVEWDGSTFDVIMMTWQGSYCPIIHHWILAENMQRAKDLFIAVCKWNTEVRGEVLVFDSGYWHKDVQLFHSIKGATFDNLILRAGLKEGLREDLTQFFAARTTYATYHIPWKRGILLVGPPGNGKTHAVKAIINTIGQPCLYVKSVHAEHRTDEDNIRIVFERARKAAPCVLVLEDLDSLLTPQNRSFFLNELDGFAANIGIVTLATTNHPERLDPAILDRPSRFDRKYPFDLPEQPERMAYISLWNATLEETLRISDAAMLQLSEATDGFSFAYLKELFLSAMMRWIARPHQATMEQALISQVDVLHEQMMSTVVQAAEAASEEAQQQVVSSGRSINRIITRRLR
jgi:ATPase family protein associated with various cellular activities (AAA)